jgi:hypothetical protein
MGWDSKPVYPVEAAHTVTVKATSEQRIAWKDAARKYGKGTAGGFLAYAADFTIAVLKALEETPSWRED